MKAQAQQLRRFVWYRPSEPKESSLAWILILPCLLMIFGLAVYPIIYSFWLSLHHASLLSQVRTFNGFENYTEVLKSAEFWASMARTMYYVFVSLAVQIVIGISVAVVLNQDFKGRRFVRSVMLLPWAIPNIVNAVMWEWIYNASYGALNGLLMQLGITNEKISWLGSKFLALNMIVAADTWKMVPFYAILLLAGMQTIPKDLYESARIDGSDSWKSFFHITIPMLKPVLLVIMVLRTMQCFGVFDIIYILTKGGPANGTMTISYYVYFETFGNLNFGKGSAISFIVAIIILLISLVYIKLLRTEEA
ncbi:sugar ABC transporter permease [Paenibacillus frigoriresistens]|uniref:carbohydrate ABC transporter permease n=1 Tax=Paenibacillus alginolyticus TaxID=59839 RepID=UPI001562EFED|nr:sugar ABC transporter permease [Paenibacillus frigoriresistens]NRF90383.1 sugar ABC transporter permease [Paenibacillus frigoriresistens]